MGDTPAWTFAPPGDGYHVPIILDPLRTMGGGSHCHVKRNY